MRDPPWIARIAALTTSIAIACALVLSEGCEATRRTAAPDAFVGGTKCASIPIRIRARRAKPLDVPSAFPIEEP